MGQIDPFKNYLYLMGLCAKKNFKKQLYRKCKYECTMNFIFTWIPSHIGIQGNERVDRAEKKALGHIYLIQKFHTLT